MNLENVHGRSAGSIQHLHRTRCIELMSRLIQHLKPYLDNDLELERILHSVRYQSELAEDISGYLELIGLGPDRSRFDRELCQFKAKLNELESMAWIRKNEPSEVWFESIVECYFGGNLPTDDDRRELHDKESLLFWDIAHLVNYCDELIRLIRSANTKPAINVPEPSNVSVENENVDNQMSKLPKSKISLSVLKDYEKKAYQLYHLGDAITGERFTQKQIAKLLSENYKSKFGQPAISKMITKVEKAVAASGLANVFADEKPQISSLPPKKIEMGRREDGLTSRQRQPFDDDEY